MSESPLRRLLVAASHYGLTSLLTMVAGLVSFPLLTRIFSVADYGLMSLVMATVTIVVALGKVGVQHSIFRYHSEISAGKSPYSLSQLVSTTFFGMVVTGFTAMVLLGGGVWLVPSRWLPDEKLRYLFPIASVLVLVQVVESVLVNIVRAEQRTDAYLKYQVGKKYLTLAMMLAALFLIARTLTAFYTANSLAELIAIATLMYVLFRGNAARPRRSEFSRPLYLELVALGIPMMIGYEMSGVVLAVGDRFVIEGKIGEEPLGLYAAAYNLCQYVQNVVILSVGQAIMPMYMKMWDEKGKDETATFISHSLARYVLFGAPVVAGVAAVGPELLPSLASARYASAAGILPWVIAGMVIDGTNAMVGAGLFIHKKTRRIMSIVMSGAIFNIVLNLLLIPHYGILGSAMATLAAYCFASFSLAAAGHQLLPVTLPWSTLLRASAGAGVMYLAVFRLLPGHRFVTVGVRAALGGVVYAAVMALIDRDARGLLKSAASRLRWRKRST